MESTEILAFIAHFSLFKSTNKKQKDESISNSPPLKFKLVFENRNIVSITIEFCWYNLAICITFVSHYLFEFFNIARELKTIFNSKSSYNYNFMFLDIQFYERCSMRCFYSIYRMFSIRYLTTFNFVSSLQSGYCSCFLLVFTHTVLLNMYKFIDVIISASGFTSSLQMFKN